MITGIEHIAISAQDSRALTDWYIRVFDFNQVYDNGKGTYFLALADGSMIEIIKSTTDKEKLAPNQHGIRHIALSVNNFDAMVSKLKTEGVEELPELSINTDNVKTYFFRDIEGNILHLIYRENPLY